MSARGISIEKLEILLEVSRAISQHRDSATLLAALATALHALVEFDVLEILLFDDENHSVKVVRPLGIPLEIGNPEDFTMDDGPGGWVWRNQKPIVVGSEELHARFPKVAALRDAQGINYCCAVPLTTSVRRVGAIEFHSKHPRSYSEDDTGFICYVASQVAVWVDNALHCESDNVSRERLQILLDATKAAIAAHGFQDLVKRIHSPVQRLCGASSCSLLLCSEQGSRDVPKDSIRLAAVYPDEGVSLQNRSQAWPIGETPFRAVTRTSQPSVLRVQGRHATDSVAPSLEYLGRGVRTICSLPLTARGQVFGVLNVGHEAEWAFSEGKIALLEEIAGQVSTSADNIRGNIEISQLKDRLAREKNYLQEEIQSVHNFEEIIGESAALKYVLEQVRLVAGLDSSVLICGETGTGKELVARAIHNLSSRSNRPLIKLNCAAIPAGLLESDLFGHEKGAFTGATSQKVGRFELAHQGTIFLDEIGDISLELQPKLLRALQEHEIERIGGTRSIKVDARIIAATNQNLEQMIAERQFRRDLYYRLNVFPIYIPPLRERPEDIPLLVTHFVQKFSKKMRREIDVISDETMNTLCHAQWPGNVRELENYIERALILTPGNELTLSPAGRSHHSAPVLPPVEMPKRNFLVSARAGLEEVEREQILRALRETNWIVAGPRGAASLLGIKRTTLHSLMRRLGISKKNALPC